MECIIDEWLTRLAEDGEILDAKWISETNAVNPWDFEITERSGERVRIEVKSTTGPFERPIHISQAEILAAAAPKALRTDLIRVYALSDMSAWVQASRDIRVFAASIAAACSAMPAGVVPDGYTVAPASFGTWTDPIHIKFEEEDEEEHV